MKRAGIHKRKFEKLRKLRLGESLGYIAARVWTEEQNHRGGWRSWAQSDLRKKREEKIHKGAEGDFSWEKARKETNGNFQWQDERWCAESCSNQGMAGIIGNGNKKRKKGAHNFSNKTYLATAFKQSDLIPSLQSGENWEWYFVTQSDPEMPSSTLASG